MNAVGQDELTVRSPCPSRSFLQLPQKFCVVPPENWVLAGDACWLTDRLGPDFESVTFNKSRLISALGLLGFVTDAGQAVCDAVGGKGA